MNKILIYKSLAIAFVALSLVMGFQAAAVADSLYIGDGGDDTVKRFDANTGRYLGPLTPPQNTGLLGPRGIIRKGNELLVANQNLNQPFNGEVLRFNKNTLALNGALVPCRDDLGRPCDPDSPFTPLGVIRGPGGKLFVADLFGPSFDPSTEGNVKEYNINDGKFIRNLDHSGFAAPFHPRAVVIGPDGLLYVSTRGFETGLEAYVLRFNPLSGKFIDVFTSFKPTASDCSKHLHRPEGLVFGPDGKLYITSFRADASDTDKILVFDRRTKQCVSQIDLYQAGQDRAFAQALVFGPNGKLFVPINNTGEVRRYDVRRKTYTSFVPKAADGGPLTQPWYLTFDETDSRTLEYED